MEANEIVTPIREEASPSELVEVAGNDGIMLSLKVKVNSKISAGNAGDLAKVKGLKTWNSEPNGSYQNFWAGHIGQKAPNGGKKGSTTGGFDPKNWCGANSKGCSGAWSRIQLDKGEAVKGIMLDGWGDSCVKQFKMSMSDDGKTYKPMDGGRTFNAKCKGKESIVFNTAAFGKFLRIEIQNGKGACCLRWSALVLQGQALTDFKESLKPPVWYVFKGRKMYKVKTKGTMYKTGNSVVTGIVNACKEFGLMPVCDNKKYSGGDCFNFGNRYHFSHPAHDRAIGFPVSKAVGIYWSTGRHGTGALYNTGRTHRWSTRFDRDGYTMCA